MNMTLYAVDQNTSEVVLWTPGEFVHATGICVRQENGQTVAWNRKTGESIALPQKTYRLSNDEGREALKADLKKIGAI